MVYSPPSPVPPPAPQFGAPGLSLEWRAAEDAARGLSIFFARGAGAPGFDVEDAVRQAAGRGTYGFYIGATVSPARRWTGFSSERGFVPGHARGCGGRDYDEMHVVALCPAGLGGARESALIQFGRTCLEGCENRASDNRGQVRDAPNFLYVVVRREPA